MRFMSEDDIDTARGRFIRSTTPNRLALVMVIDHLREWTDSHSDGWAYWPKPRNAAQLAIDQIYSTTYEANRAQEAYDITNAEMQAAVRPIKAFLTRQKVSAHDREIILRSVN